MSDIPDLVEEQQKIPVYSLIGCDGKNAVKIKPRGYICEELRDSGVHQFEINKDLKGKISVCNISDSFLMSNKKLPFMNVSIYNHRKVVDTVIMNIRYSFEITDEVTSEKQLIGGELHGKFYIELYYQYNKKNGYKILDLKDSNLDKFPGSKMICEILQGVATTKEMIELYSKLLGDLDKEREIKYGSNYDADIPVPTVSFR